MRTFLILVTGVVGGLLAATLLLGSAVIGTQTAGAAVEDTTYTAITPCASFDSRTDAGALAGKFAHGETRTYQAAGAASGDQQNGVDCDVPASAVAVLINVVAIAPDTGGNLRAYATGSSGTGGIVNYAAVTPNLNNSNAVVIPLSTNGQLDIENNCGGCVGDVIHVRGVILGYYTNTLASRVAALEAILTGITRDNQGPNNADRLLISGMNVQIVDGTGDTECSSSNFTGGAVGTGEPCNGLGNLIVGYNEENDLIALPKTGAHNLVLGPDHGYTSYGGAVFGGFNLVSGVSSSVTGGSSNTASGTTSSVTGGRGNIASGWSSSVTGGVENRASGSGSSASGGLRNTATGRYTSVSGGRDNTASAETCSDVQDPGSASVAGGRSNVASGCYASIIGGEGNTASGANTSVSGGRGNIASGADCTELEDAASVAGGRSNVASGCYAAIIGGHSSTASGDRSTVVGGEDNAATGLDATVSGGAQNKASGGNASVSGGLANTASGNNASVSGGNNRDASGTNDWRAGTLFEDF